MRSVRNTSQYFNEKRRRNSSKYSTNANKTSTAGKFQLIVCPLFSLIIFSWIHEKLKCIKF